MVGEGLVYLMRLGNIVQLIAIVTSFVMLSASVGVAQYQYYNPNDERYKFLALKKAEVRLQELRQTYENNKSLLEKNLISQDSYNKIESEYKLAEIEFQQAMLAVIFEKPYITVKKAVKYLTEDKRKRVRLILENSAAGSLDMGKLDLLNPLDESTAFVEYLDFDKLTNVYVSLKDNGIIISQPYEIKIEEMIYGKPVELDFGLLADLNYVTVSCRYGDVIDNKQIMLMKNSNYNQVSITSLQFSQEADLGGDCKYDLSLEAFSSGNMTYQMALVNIPPQITYEFRSTDNTRISQIKFTEEITTQKVSLSLFLPIRADDQIIIDTPIVFYVVAYDPEVSKNIRGNRNYSETDIASWDCGKAKLELIPRGIGEIELIANQLYQDIRIGNSINADFELRNTGTVPIYNIQTKLDLPYDWTGAITPDVVDVLEAGKEIRLILESFSPEDAGVGDYEISVMARAYVNNRLIETDAKTMRVHLSGSTGYLGPLLLTMMVILVIGGTVYLGRKLSRR